VIGLRTKAAVAVLAATLGAGAAAWAADGEAAHIERQHWTFSGMLGHFNAAQLQRGFRVYTEICSRCHSVKRLSFRNLVQPGGPAFPEAGVRSLAADNYKVDPVHSSIIFRAQHVQTGYVYGRFDKFSGTVKVDSDPSNMAFDISIDVNSINTGNEKRDGHLKSPDFFGAKEFSTITFKSKSVKSAGENKYEVTGDLTLHGQTKSVTIPVEKTGESNTPNFGQRVGFASTFTVKRSDYGMS